MQAQTNVHRSGFDTNRAARACEAEMVARYAKAAAKSAERETWSMPCLVFDARRVSEGTHSKGYMSFGGIIRPLDKRVGEAPSSVPEARFHTSTFQFCFQCLQEYSV